MTLVTRLTRRVGSVGRKGAASATINAIASTLDLVSFAIVARILSPESLGIFLIALAVGTLAGRVGSPNFAQTFMRHTVRAIEQQHASDLRHILQLALVFESGRLALGLASGIATAALLVPSDNQSIFAAVVITVLFPALRPPLLAVAIPRALGRHEAVAGWIMLGALVKLMILAVVLMDNGGMMGVAIAFATGALVLAIGGLTITVVQARHHGALSVRRSGPSSFAERHEDFWTLTRVGAIAVLPQTVIEFSTVLIGALSGVLAAGLYRLATKVGDAAKIYTTPIAFVVYSDQCKAVEQFNLHRLWSQTIRWCLFVGAVTGLGLVVFLIAGPLLVDMIFGEGYDAAVPAITLCIVAAVPHSMSMLLQFGLFALGAANYVLRAESIGAALFLLIIAAFQTPSAEQAGVALAISRSVALATFAVLFVLAVQQRKNALDHRVS